MDPELQDHYDGVVWCLMRYGGMGEDEAKKRIEASGLYARAQDNMSRGNILHETSYFWAMEMLHARTNPYWWKDFPELSSPPEEYNEWQRIRKLSPR